MLVKCHGEPENHNALHDHGKTTLCQWEIYTDTIRKKWEELIHSSYLDVKFLNFTTHIVAAIDLNLKQKLRKKWSSILNIYELSDRQFENC